ncbi:MAG: DinB family protein [Terracidiphilus sp.]
MSELNPYAKFLDGTPLEVVLASTPAALTEIINTIGPEKTTAPPAPGKWSPAEIACHLADCELAFGFRIRQTLAEENHVIQPFDQEKWAAAYSRIPVAQALAAFAALRNWNLLLINNALPEAATKLVTHPERGAMTFQHIVETMAGHDLNHLAQLKKLT